MAKSIYEILVQIEGNEKAKSALNAIGKAAGLTGGALLAFSGAAAKSAAAYETSLAAVSTVATKATGTTAEFDAALNGLATEMNGAISISDAAKASYDILSSGFSNQADVLTILRESQKTAVGGFSDLGTISDATTTVMNSFGDALGATLDTTQRVQLVTNGMIATQNLGKITAGEYASQIGNVASTAAAAGVSLEEVNAAISVSTASGINASSSFAGFNQILAVLMKPTAEATELATQLGIEFNAAALQSKGLSGVLADIIDKGGASAENMTKLFGSVEATKVAMTLVAGEGAKFNDFLGQMENTAGSVDKAFATMSETTEQKVARALNQLNDSFVKLGQGVLIAVEPAINALAFLVDKFTLLPVPIQQTVGAVVLASGATITLAGAIALVTVSLSTAAGGIAAFVGAVGTAKVAMASFATYNYLTIGTIGGLIKFFGLMVLAIGAVAIAYDALRDKGAVFEEDTADMRNAIRETREELAKYNEEVGKTKPPELEKVEAKKKWYDVTGEGLAYDQRTAAEGARNARAALQDIIIEYQKLGDSTKEAEEKQKLYAQGIKSINNAISKLDENKLGSDVYNQLRGELVGAKKGLDRVAESTKKTGDAAVTTTPEIEALTKATEESAKAAEAEAEAKAKSQAISSIEDEIAKKKEDDALNRQKEAQIKKITEAMEAQTEAIKKQQDAEIEALQGNREDQKTAQSTAYQDGIEAIKDQAELDRMARKQADELQIEGIKDTREQQRSAQSAAYEDQIERAKDAFEADRDAKKLQFEDGVEKLKDTRSAARMKSEQAMADKIAARLEAQAASFSRASNLASEQERIWAAETEEEKAKIANEFAAKRRIEDEAATMNLANKVFSSSQLVSMATGLAGVGSVNSLEDAQKVQFALGEIEKQQKAQQAEADKVAVEKLAEKQRRADIATETEIQALQRAFDAEQKAADIAQRELLQASEMAFKENERQLDKAAETEIAQIQATIDSNEKAIDLAFRENLQAREAAFNAEQRSLDEQTALKIETIKAAAEQKLRAEAAKREGLVSGVNASFDAQAYRNSIQQKAGAAGLSAEESKRLVSLTESSGAKLQAQIETAKQNLGTLQTVQNTGQAQLQTTETLSANAKAYLQSQVSELQKINVTNASILASVRFISAQVNGLPTAIAAKIPRPAPTPAPSR